MRVSVSIITWLAGSGHFISHWIHSIVWVIKYKAPLFEVGPQPATVGCVRQLTWNVAHDSSFSDTVGVLRNLWNRWICPGFNSMCPQIFTFGRLLNIPFYVMFLLHCDPQKSNHKTNKQELHVGLFLQLLMVAQLPTCQSITTEIVWSILRTLSLKWLLLSDRRDRWHFAFHLRQTIQQRPQARTHLSLAQTWSW